MARLQAIVPCSITAETSFTDIREAVEFYTADLPNSDLVDEEFARWKRRWISVAQESRPQNLQECLAPGVCTTPDIRTLFQLFATLSFSTSSSELSASALRCFNNYLHTAQTKDQLSAAALIHCNYAAPVDINEMCKIFMEKHPLRMDARSLLFES